MLKELGHRLKGFFEMSPRSLLRPREYVGCNQINAEAPLMNFTPNMNK